MRDALAGVPQRRLPMPDGVVTARVAPTVAAFGDDAPPEFEYFLADHLPEGATGEDGGTGEPAGQPYEDPIF